MNKISFYIFLVLFISGCVTTAKTVKPTTMPVGPISTVQKQTLPVAPVAVKQPVAKENITALPSPKTHPALVKASPVSGEGMIQEAPITYSQITNVIDEFLDIKPVEAISGKHRFLGTSENHLVTLEVLGSADNVSEASMKLVYPNDIEKINADLNNAMMLRFLRNIAPEFKDWSNRMQGILKRFYGVAIGNIAEDKITFGQKILHILYDRKENSITLTLRRI